MLELTNVVSGVEKDMSCVREGVCGSLTYTAVTPEEKVLLSVCVADV